MAKDFRPPVPKPGNGVEIGADTAVEQTALDIALDAAAGLLRHPKYPDQRRRNGTFAIGNAVRRTHGGSSRKTLRKDKAAIRAELETQYADEDGQIHYPVKLLIPQLADALAHGAVASEHANKVDASGEPITGGDYEKTLSVRLHHSDRVRMLVQAIETLRGNTGSGRASTPSFKLFTVSSPSTPVPAPTGRNSVPGFCIVAHDDVDETPEVLERLDGPSRSIPGLEFTSITPREPARMRSHDPEGG